MTTEIRTINAKRNGKPISMNVEVKYCGDKSEATMAWIKKENGKPLFGTTGYWTFGGIWAKPDIIKTYRGKEILTDVEFI